MIAELVIPKDAKRSSAVGRKCRSDKALVVSITDSEGKHHLQGVSSHDENFKYLVNEYVSVDNFEDNRFIECAAGIHFFITKQEAIDY